MLLEELTVEHIRVVIESWKRNFGFCHANSDIYLEFPDILLREVASTLRKDTDYETRIGIKLNDDCKLRFRLGYDEHVEVKFDLNRGRITPLEYDLRLGKAEEQFKKEVTKIGLRYYR